MLGASEKEGTRDKMYSKMRTAGIWPYSMYNHCMAHSTTICYTDLQIYMHVAKILTCPQISELPSAIILARHRIKHVFRLQAQTRSGAIGLIMFLFGMGPLGQRARCVHFKCIWRH